MGEKKKPEGVHQALYRKYRSKSLDEIVGQEHITKTLANAIKQGKISHAYLFTGPRGVGKTSIARILAHEINGLPYEDEKPHLDIIEIDAASNRRIDDIRDLRDKVNIAPTSARYKVYIIDEVHMLTNESFNALLKTLEEPPAHVIFILATTEVHKLPATIVSRTQRHSFRLISPEKVIAHLKDIAKHEGISITDEALALLAEHGEGSFRDSISLLDQMSGSGEAITAELIELILGLAPQQSLQALLEAARHGQGSEVIHQIESLVEAGLTASAIAGQLLSVLRKEAKTGNITPQTITLMEDLLNVQAAQYPEMKLETILLGLNPSDKLCDSVPAPIPKPPERPPKESDTSTGKKSTTEQKPVSAAVNVSESIKTSKPVAHAKNSKSAATSTLPASVDIDAAWPKILEITKTKNNSLYTVLRLATPEVNGSELILSFNFGFHQKKVNEARYKSILAEIIAEVTHQDVTIEAIVDKTKITPRTEASTATPDPAHASLITNVQDIMGGGEVVTI